MSRTLNSVFGRTIASKTKFVVPGQTAMENKIPQWQKLVKAVDQLQSGAVGAVTNSDQNLTLARNSNHLDVALKPTFVAAALKGATSVQNLQNSDGIVSIKPGTGVENNGVPVGNTEVFIAPGKYIESIVTESPEYAAITEGTGTEGNGIPLGTVKINVPDVDNNDGYLKVTQPETTDPETAGTIYIDLSDELKEIVDQLVAGGGGSGTPTDYVGVSPIVVVRTRDEDDTKDIITISFDQSVPISNPPTEFDPATSPPPTGPGQTQRRQVPTPDGTDIWVEWESEDLDGDGDWTWSDPVPVTGPDVPPDRADPITQPAKTTDAERALINPAIYFARTAFFGPGSSRPELVGVVGAGVGGMWATGGPLYAAGMEFPGPTTNQWTHNSVDIAFSLARIGETRWHALLAGYGGISPAFLDRDLMGWEIRIAPGQVPSGGFGGYVGNDVHMYVRFGSAAAMTALHGKMM